MLLVGSASSNISNCSALIPLFYFERVSSLQMFSITSNPDEYVKYTQQI